MAQNKQDEKRARYTQKIMEKEAEKEDLIREKLKLEEALFNLESRLHKGFQELEALTEEDRYFGNLKSAKQQQVNQEQAHMFQQTVTDAIETIEQAYQNETKKIEDESEIYYQKRSEIPWD